MADEIVDVAARAEIKAHMKVCEQVYRSNELAFKRNEADHLDLKHSMRDFSNEATSRWKWLITIIIGGLAAIITMLIKIITANNTAGWL